MSRIESHINLSRADMPTVEYLLKVIPDWNRVVIERQQKFITAYFQYKGKLDVIGKAYNFSSKDMLSIYWRIQKVLIMEYVPRVLKGKIDTTVEPSNLFYDFLAWQLQHIEGPNAEITFNAIQALLEDTITLNIDGVTENKKKQIEEVLNELHKVSNLEEVIPVKYSKLVNDLFKGMAFTTALEKNRLKKQYTMDILVGRPNGRTSAEKGLLYIVGEANKAGVVKYKGKRPKVVKMEDFTKKKELSPKFKKEKSTELSEAFIEVLEMVDMMPDWRTYLSDTQIRYIEALVKYRNLEKVSQVLNVKETNLRSTIAARTSSYSAHARLMKGFTK
jgi:hypothetical protein